MDKERRDPESLNLDRTQVLQPLQLEEKDLVSQKTPTLMVLNGADEGKVFKINQPAMSMGREKTVHISLNDQTVSRKHCLLIQSAGGITLVDLESSNGTHVNNQRIEKKKLENGDKITIGHTILKFEIADLDLSTYQEKIYRQITFDDLTSLYNHKSMSKQLEMMFSALPKYLPFSLLFIDIDRFKEINDTHGHLTGSKILSDLGRLLLSNLRSNDFPCRYGGEEFLVILSQSTARNACFVAEKIRKIIQDHIFHTHTGQPIQLTVSIGVAPATSKSKSHLELIQRADEAMYWAKENGRNRSVLFRIRDQNRIPSFEILTPP